MKSTFLRESRENFMPWGYEMNFLTKRWPSKKNNYTKNSKSIGSITDREPGKKYCYLEFRY